MNFLIAPILVGLWIGFAVPAFANIYSWTGNDGVLYFSDKPDNPDAKVFIKIDPKTVHEQALPAQIQTAPDERDEWEAKLNAAHAKLDEALDRVETLTEQVETAESKAAASAAAAALAAEDAADQAQQASESIDDSHRSRGVVYYGAPYIYTKRHKHSLSKSNYRNRSKQDFNHRFRSAGKNHNVFAKQKHQLKRWPHRNQHSRGDVLIKKSTKQHRERLSHKHRSDNFVNNKFKKFYRRSTTAKSIGHPSRHFGRN